MYWMRALRSCVPTLDRQVQHWRQRGGHRPAARLPRLFALRDRGAHRWAAGGTQLLPRPSARHGVHIYAALVTGSGSPCKGHEAEAWRLESPCPCPCLQAKTSTLMAILQEVVTGMASSLRLPESRVRVVHTHELMGCTCKPREALSTLDPAPRTSWFVGLMSAQAPTASTAQDQPRMAWANAAMHGSVQLTHACVRALWAAPDLQVVSCTEDIPARQFNAWYCAYVPSTSSAESMDALDTAGWVLPVPATPQRKHAARCCSVGGRGDGRGACRQHGQMHLPLAVDRSDCMLGNDIITDVVSS